LTHMIVFLINLGSFVVPVAETFVARFFVAFFLVVTILILHC